MTIQRVRIDSTASSPFRVSVAGVDVSSAEFNTLIFDANQSPLRLWATGYGSVGGTTWNEHLGGKNMTEASIAGGFVTPAGTTAIFMAMWRNTSDSAGRVFSPSSQGTNNGGATIGGGGGAICSGTFIGTCFSTGPPLNPDTLPAPIYANYCIFKNYN